MVANREMELTLMTVGMTVLLRNALYAGVMPPPQEPDDAARRLELGAAATDTDHGAAVAHLRAALAGELDTDQRFRATALLARVLGETSRAAEAADLLEEQMDAFAERPDLLRAAEVALANVTRTNPLTRPRAADAIERLRHRVRYRGERDPAVMATVAAEMALAGEAADETAQLAEDAVSGMRAAACRGWSWHEGVRALVLTERYDAALRRLAGRDSHGALMLQGELHLRRGDLAAAEADGRALYASARTRPLAEEWAAVILAEVLIERGELAGAEALLEPRFAGPAALLARGRLRLAQGRPDAAADELRECGRRARDLDIANPAILPWRSTLAHALRACGRPSEATRLAEEELELARRFGAPRAIGVALRAAADDDVARLREAADLLEAAPLERARALTDLGCALRRAGDEIDAREPLRLAVDLAHRCGATELEEHALSELRATGARPRRRLATGAGALTPSERRIAELAASGRLNREIAEILVVTLATVEYHLRNAYRKLGIASRRELVTAL
jgi:DNA-binding CsgD family transcriptional regulator